MTGSKASTVLALVVFVVSVAALVTLEVMGRPTDTLMLLVGPVVSALLVNAYIGQKVSTVEQKVDTVATQTNGMLDARIRLHAEAASTASLVKAGLVTPAQPPQSAPTPPSV